MPSQFVVAVLFLTSLQVCRAMDPYSTCLSNYSVLEQALVEVGDNRYNIIKTFYPSTSTSPSVYVKVKYVSVENDTVEGTWLWTKVPIYLIYPPSIFQYTSLLFNYHSISKQVQDDLMIQLPTACYNTSPCQDSDGIVIQNRYLDVLTNELYLYAQYNGKNARVVLDDQPSTSMRYDCLSYVDKSEKISFHFFSVFCLLLPYVLLLLFVILVHTCRPKIRRLFIHTSPDSTVNQNFAAVVSTGIVFSLYVLVCDGLSLVHAINLVDDSDSYSKDRKPYIVMIFVTDSLFFSIAVLNIFILACNKQRTKFMMYYACCFVRVCFCKRFNYHRIDGVDQYNYRSSKFNSNKLEKDWNDRENRLHHEKKLWLLLISLVSPLTCIGTHASFIIMAWSSDPAQASSMTVLFVISFIYYFFGFRQLYVIFTSGPFIRKVQRKRIVSIEDTTEDVSVEFTSTHTSTSESGSSSHAHSSPTSHVECTSSFGGTPRQTEFHSHKWINIRNKPKVTWEKQSRHTCVPLTYEDETAGLNTNFNFIVLLGELFFATLVLAVIEGLTIAVYFFLPAPVSTVPANVLYIFHLAIVIGGGLVAYKLLTFHTPTEQLLLKSVLNSYDPETRNRSTLEDTAKRVGAILGNLLKKIETKEDEAAV